MGRTAAPGIAAFMLPPCLGPRRPQYAGGKERRKRKLYNHMQPKVFNDAMLGFLFPRLTASPQRGAALFDAVTAEARKRFWYREGGVPDTLDGRFAVLATVGALVLIRLERLGPEGGRISVAFTERFIEVMESEHRELGIGDPTLGRTVRKLVGMLAKRTALWRSTLNGESDWNKAARESLYRKDVPLDSLGRSVAALRSLDQRLSTIPAEGLEQGNLDERPIRP